MATLATLSVDVLTDVSKFQQGLTSAGAKLKSFGDNASRMGATLSKSVTLPIVGIGIAAVGAFSDAEKVQAQTQAALSSTGKAAGVTAAHISALANSLSMLSGTDDETIQSSENLLLTFTNIQNQVGKNNDIFDQATKAVLDMSTAMGQDTKSSAVMLGKALNDPIKGLTSLTRVGVAFSDAQKAQITAMVAAGNAMGAQKIILHELNTEFGGSAAAMGRTTEGMVSIMNVQLGNALEQIGQVIVTTVLPVFERLVGWLQSVANWFNNLSPGIQSAIVQVAAIAAAVGPALFVFGKLVTGIGAVINVMRVLTAAMSANPYILIAAATIAITVLVVKNWDTVKGALLAVWNAIADAAKFWWDHVAIFVMGPVKFIIDWLVTHWRGVKDVLLEVWNTIGDVFTNVWHGIETVARTVVNGIISALNVLIAGINKAQDALDVLAGPTINFEHVKPIPHLATGGIVTSPTMALIGERGPEAVVPLRAGGMQPINIYLNGAILGKTDDVVREIHQGLLRLQKRNATLGFA